MNKLQALRCIEVTSQTQANNGTVCYHDPITGADYLSYESGYIRRSYKTKSWRTGKALNTIYQLNPQKKTPWISEYNGVIYQGHSTARVMLPTHEERMEKLAQAIATWRQTLKKQNYNPVYNY